MIHSVECPSLLRANEQRFIPAYWLIHDGGRVATLEVVLSDRLGALSDLTRILYEAAVNIIDINSTPSWDEEAFTVTINIEVPQ